MYDELGQQTSCTDRLSDKVSYEYDAAGNQTAVVDGLGARSICVFDALDCQTSCADCNGSTTSAAYDRNGNLLSMTDPEGASPATPTMAATCRCRRPTPTRQDRRTCRPSPTTVLAA